MIIEVFTQFSHHYKPILALVNLHWQID